MADLEKALVQLLRDFTAKVAVVVRQNAMESASAVLVSAAARFGDPSGKTAPGPQRAVRAARRAPLAGKQSFDAEAAGDQVASFLVSKPGLRVEELAVALQLPTEALKPLVKKLVGQGRLRVEGQARGTRYFPNSARASGAKGGRKKAKAKPGRKRSKKA